MDVGLIRNGIVEDVICADSVQLAQQHFPDHTCIERAGGLHFGPGWLYDGANFTEPPPVAPTVPTEVTMRQARLALFAAGKLSAVAAAIASLPEPEKTAAQIEWEYSGVVQRHKPLVLALAPALGLTDAQLDALFIAAAAIE